MKKNSIKDSMYYIKYIVKFDCIRLPGVVITTLINSFDDWFMKVFVVKMIIDALLNSFDLNYILWMIIIAIGFKSLKTIYDSCWSYYTKRSDQKIVSGFQHVAFLKAADVDLQCYDDSDFYNEYVYSVQDSSSRPILFINSIAQLLQTVFTVSFSGLYVIVNDPVLLFFVVIPILGDSFLRTKMSKARGERTSLIIPENRKIDYVKRISYLKENAMDIRTTKIHLVLMKLLHDGVDNIINIYKKYSKKFIGMYFFSDCLTHLNNTIVVFYIIYKIVILKALTAGDFVAIKEAISLVSSNLGKVMERVQVFQEHSIYISRYRAFCEYENKVVFGSYALPEPKESSLELGINHVSFSYNPESEILNQIDFSIKKGELIGIVGSNGMGKSTLVKLLLHMYDPTNGVVEFRGIDIKELRKDDYLSKFDTVFQEHNSYAFTLADNIAFISDLSDYQINKMKEIFHSLGIDEFSEYVDKAISLTKEFSEDGLVQSGGQIQKIAIARALYRNSDVLILDEPTSALDALAEHKFMKSLRQHAKDKTVVLISHRLSLVRNADCIYFIENGKISERGTHEELMNQQGKYYEMFTIQSNAYRD